MEESERISCLKLASVGVKEVGGVTVPLTTEEIVKRAREFYKFTSEGKGSWG